MYCNKLFNLFSYCEIKKTFLSLIAFFIIIGLNRKSINLEVLLNSSNQKPKVEHVTSLIDLELIQTHWSKKTI